MDSHLRLVKEAREAALLEGYKNGYEAGTKHGREVAFDEVRIDPEWQPAVALINAVYADPSSVIPPQHVLQAPEQVQARAASWRRMRESAAWVDVTTALAMDARRRLRDIVAGGEDIEVNRAIIALEEQLLGLPDTVIQYAEQLQQAEAGQLPGQE